ncbi:MAG: FKBP-type peptidyl-prolyl cis-trans isomerase [Bacteroidota bacterium]
MKINILITLLFTLFLAACGGDTETKKPDVDYNQVRDPLINANKMINQSEEDQIKGYIKRHQLMMEKTTSGLRYQIYFEGKGSKVEKFCRVKLKYRLSLINGVECYNSEKDGMKEFNVGTGEVENGLNEAVLLMKQGDKARLIIPSHLGFGLVGDEDKIPAKAILIYDLEVFQVVQPK